MGKDREPDRETGPEGRSDEPAADLGAGAPPERPPLPQPDELAQSPQYVAGIGPGGEPYGEGRSPSEQNPAADPGGDPARYD